MFKREFIPTQFTESGGDCTICNSRWAFEDRLGAESDLITDFGTALFASLMIEQMPSAAPETTKLYLQLPQGLANAIADYRVCFAQNLALYFSAERHGRLLKVPEFAGACDQYRDRALSSLQEYDVLFERFKAVAARQHGQEEVFQKLAAAHAQTMATATEFWLEIAKWTEERNKTARSGMFGGLL